MRMKKYIMQFLKIWEIKEVSQIFVAMICVEYIYVHRKMGDRTFGFVETLFGKQLFSLCLFKSIFLFLFQLYGLQHTLKTLRNTKLLFQKFCV